MKVIASADINAPAAKVWELMSTPHRYPELVVATDRMVSVPDAPLGVGSIYREYGGLPPFKAESEWRVAVFEPPSRQVHVGDDGTMAFDLDIRVTPRDGGCQLVLALGLRPRWYMAVPSAILWRLFMMRRAQAMQDETVANTKRVAESETDSRP
jgi:hypothetical protein